MSLLLCYFPYLSSQKPVQQQQLQQQQQKIIIEQNKTMKLCSSKKKKGTLDIPHIYQYITGGVIPNLGKAYVP